MQMLLSFQYVRGHSQVSYAFGDTLVLSQTLDMHVVTPQNVAAWYWHMHAVHLCDDMIDT